ncbi:MAG: hypothetical protein QOJ86_2212, partial [Bradyrhizobium sp.]|nr:hypothetical protein [Bradyrhizobium sp.]
KSNPVTVPTTVPIGDFSTTELRDSVSPNGT